MKLILNCDGKIVPEELPLTRDSSELIDVAICFCPTDVKVGEDEKLVLFLKSDVSEGSFFVTNGKASVPAKFFDGTFISFGCARIRNGVTLKKWQSEPIGVYKHEFTFTITDDFKNALDRICALENEVEKLRRIMAGYSVL